MKILIASVLLTACFSQAHGQRVVDDLCADARVTVLIFMGVDCPISQKYVPSLNKLRKKYEGQGVAFHAVIPGNVKGRDLQRFKRDYALSFDIRSDPKFKVAKAVSANATPEVFVFDLDHQLRYHGAIDNWFFGLGGYRSAATENYLSDAIDSILAGKTPEVRETKALGCVIQVPL